MSPADAFQSLKPRYFEWLDAQASVRPALLEKWRVQLTPDDFAALLQLIAQSEHLALIDAQREVHAAQAGRARHAVHVGQQFGPFVIRAWIGGGGMGDVYLAERVSGGFQQRVALKLVRPEFASPALRKRFEREREILARLSHPNIASLLDGGLHQGVPWFAMAFVEGETLAARLQTGRLDLRSALAIAIQIAQALTEAHRKLVIHRDLKPSNVMLEHADNVKLLDFGVGKILDSSEPGETRTGLAPMTLRYASPEQLSGEPTSTSTDIYQLGLLLSEMLLGEPTRAEDALARARHLPQDVRAVLRQALGTQAALRYASAAEFAADLRRLIAYEPVSAMAARWHYRTQRFIARNRALSAALAFAVITLLAGAATSIWQARAAKRNAEAAQHNAEVLLRLLNVAAPQNYRNADPGLAKYLSNSALQLQQDLANEPDFLAQSLSQIGNGLINLDQPAAARNVLLRAHAAAVRAGFSAEREFAILRLLAYTVEPPVALKDAQNLSQQIVRKLTDSPCGEGLNALASITNSLSRHQDQTTVAANLALINQLQTRVTQTDPDQENLLRQLGKIALRTAEKTPSAAAQAQDYFTRAAALHARAPDQYSALRVAEGQAFLAQAALAAGEILVAQHAWQQAQPPFAQSYQRDDLAMQEFVALGRMIAQAQRAPTSAPMR
jgi:eukaryotic-like serine/threonine-protein kinase